MHSNDIYVYGLLLIYTSFFLIIFIYKWSLFAICCFINLSRFDYFYRELSTKNSNYNKRISCAVVAVMIATTNAYLLVDTTFVGEIPSRCEGKLHF